MILTTERQKKIKNIWIKIEVEKEIERRGDSINKVSNHRNTNKIHKCEEKTILRKWIKIKVDLIKII